MVEPDYSKVFEAYKRLPPNIKGEFDKFRAKNYAKASPPPEQMQKDLEAIITKHQDGTVSKASASNMGYDRWRYAAGLAAIALLLGIPYL